MEHQIELLTRSPTKDFKFLVANVPEKYFREINSPQQACKVENQETENPKSSRKAKHKQRKKRFAQVCKATLGYIKGLEDLLMFVLERKTGACSSKGEMYYHASISQVCEDMLEQPLSSEYTCSRRPCNMTDEDKCVMQYFIHQQVQAVDPQLCASLQLLSHDQITTETWTRQHRSPCPGSVPPPLFTMPLMTSMKQMSGGGIVCQQASLPPASPPILFPCCSSPPPCPLLPVPDCPECASPPPPPQTLPCCSEVITTSTASSSLALPPPPPPPPPPPHPEVFSACSRLCDSSSSLDCCLPATSSYQSAMQDLLLEGCESPTESFQDFDTNLWNDKVPMDIDDIEVAQLAF